MVEPSADPGLQAERTALAWRRTQLALLAIACLALRAQHASVALVALATCGLLWLGHDRNYRHALLMLREERGQARPWTALSAGLALLAMALLAIADALHRHTQP